MRIDLHLHSTFSPDAHVVPEDLVKKAVERSYTQIAFTEHVDPEDDPYTPCHPETYAAARREILRLREAYPQLSILFGAEVGEYHLHRENVARLFAATPPDYVIASSHLVNGLNLSIPMPALPPRETIRQYYLDNLALLDVPGVHTLGHLGIYKRYLSDGYDDHFCDDLIDRILRTLVERKICLEINTSGLRRPLQSLIPEPDVLQRYRGFGGELLTLGSDSHTLEHFDAVYDEAVARLRNLGWRYAACRENDSWKMLPLS